VVLEPGQAWQIDVCSGLVGVKGSKSFLNIIDMYSGFALPVALKSETSEEIAKILENHLIKSFGPPKEISSDNAANLQGPEIKKFCKFYNISYRTTVPYSPTSHALVEISNRYITQLLRIFSDQFQANWPP
jgi:transposase InsO family protein